MSFFGRRNKPKPTPEVAPAKHFIKIVDAADAVILNLAIDHFAHGTWNNKDIQIILDHIPDEGNKAQFRAGVDASLARMKAYIADLAHEDALLDEEK